VRCPINSCHQFITFLFSSVFLLFFFVSTNNFSPTTQKAASQFQLSVLPASAGDPSPPPRAPSRLCPTRTNPNIPSPKNNHHFHLLYLIHARTYSFSTTFLVRFSRTLNPIHPPNLAEPYGREPKKERGTGGDDGSRVVSIR